jgi:hypothetical protein
MIPVQSPQSTVPLSAAHFSPASPTPSSFTYWNRLHPWCILRLLPKMQRTVVARFRRRNDAEAHLKILQQLNPDAEYLIIFDPPDRPADA